MTILSGITNFLIVTSLEVPFLSSPIIFFHPSTCTGAFYAGNTCVQGSYIRDANTEGTYIGNTCDMDTCIESAGVGNISAVEC